MTDRQLPSGGTWDYRVIRYEDGTLQVHEVYYNADGTPWAMTENPCGPMGMDRQELRRDFVHMLRALRKPVIPIEEANQW